MKLKLEALIQPGEAVLTLPGFLPIACVVRWSDGRLTGLSFNQLIPLGELIPWLKEREAERLARGTGSQSGGSIAA